MEVCLPLELEINERSTFVYTAILKDEDGNPVELAAIDSLTLTIIEEESGDVVNSRNAQDVLNNNNVTLHASTGLLTWNVQVLDTAIVNTETPYGSFETHIATFTIAWTDGAEEKQMHREIFLKVKNLRSVA